MNLWDTKLLKRFPAAIAINEAAIKANVPARKIEVLLISLCEANEKVAKFVLSPSSASRMVIKIIKKAFKFKN